MLCILILTKGKSFNFFYLFDLRMLYLYKMCIHICLWQWRKIGLKKILTNRITGGVGGGVGGKNSIGK